MHLKVYRHRPTDRDYNSAQSTSRHFEHDSAQPNLTSFQISLDLTRPSATDRMFTNLSQQI